ncbi:MAG TPA: HAD hydrolase family protein [Vicinamibacteria bacterium]|nr:HAD hydrolase family protein [Vicinamibacteria bacterium]
MSDLLVATDLDSCLLDESYSPEPALPAVRALREAGVPLVLASSKTRAEVEPLWRELQLDAPFVVENGGALLFPEDPHLPWARPNGGLHALELGVQRRELLLALHEIADETGTRLLGFASLGPSGIAAATGLSPAAAQLAAAREFDEPFLCEGDDPDAVARVVARAAARGLRVTRGGRFLHLSGSVDKGHALLALLRHETARGRRHATVGLGDAGNDLGLLQVVDRPILVPRPNGQVDPELEQALPRAERAPSPGPAGWNTAVLAVLKGERLTRAVEA